MIRNSLVLFLSVFSLLAACKKDDDNSPSGTKEAVADYLLLKPGNYWIYESYVVDSNGNGSPGTYNGQSSVYDSVYVIADTVINNELYHRFRAPVEAGSTNYDTHTLRDSLDYIVDVSGFVVFSLSDSATVFLSRTYHQPLFSDDSVVTVNYGRGNNQVIATPAGTFNTASMGYRWTFYPFKSANAPVNSRRQYKRYAKGIGMVTETMPFYAGIPEYIERRLIRYHVQ